VVTTVQLKRSIILAQILFGLNDRSVYTIDRISMKDLLREKVAECAEKLVWIFLRKDVGIWTFGREWSLDFSKAKNDSDSKESIMIID